MKGQTPCWIRTCYDLGCGQIKESTLVTTLSRTSHRPQLMWYLCCHQWLNVLVNTQEKWLKFTLDSLFQFWDKVSSLWYIVFYIIPDKLEVRIFGNLLINYYINHLFFQDMFVTKAELFGDIGFVRSPAISQPKVNDHIVSWFMLAYSKITHWF